MYDVIVYQNLRFCSSTRKRLSGAFEYSNCLFSKTLASEYDDVVHIYLLAFHMLSTVFMWKGENDSNTLRVDAYFLMVTALENGLLMRRTENFLCWRIWGSCAVCQSQLSNNNIKCNKTTVNKNIQLNKNSNDETTVGNMSWLFSVSWITYLTQRLEFFFY